MFWVLFAQDLFYDWGLREPQILLTILNQLTSLFVCFPCMSVALQKAFFLWKREKND